MDDLRMLQTVLSIVDTAGTVSLLFLMLFLFYTGRIIPKRVHDEIVQIYREQFEKLVSNTSTQLNQLVENIKNGKEVV